MVGKEWGIRAATYSACDVLFRRGIEQPVENARNLRFADLAGPVIFRAALSVEDHDVRDIALEIFFDEWLLLRRLGLVQVDDYKLYPALILFVEAYGAASLPLGVESTLAEHENIVGFAACGAGCEVIAGNEWAVVAVAGIVESRIQPQVFSGPQACCPAQRHGQRNQGYKFPHRIQLSFLRSWLGPKL